METPLLVGGLTERERDSHEGLVVMKFKQSSRQFLLFRQKNGKGAEKTAFWVYDGYLEDI